MVLGELLRDRGIAPGAGAQCDDYVIWVEPEQRSLGMHLARGLRREGRAVLYGLKTLGVGKQLRSANRLGAARVLIIGPDEAASGTVTVRCLASGRQETTTLKALLGGRGSEAGANPAERRSTVPGSTEVGGR